MSKTESQPQSRDLLEFKTAKSYLDELIGNWNDEISETKQRRDERLIDLDVRALRSTGKLRPDETLIPERVTDLNITREQPGYLAFLNKARRIALFQSVDNPEFNSQRLEKEFTRGMTYSGWVNTYFKLIDGFQLHGWSFIEVIYDTSKPFHVCHEYVSHDKFLFPQDLEDIQDAEYVIRIYSITPSKLKEFVDNYGLDAKQVSLLLEENKTARDRTKKHTIYKIYIKKDGLVFIAWYSKDSNVSEWLKAPEPLYLGIAEPAAQEPLVDSTLLSQGGIENTVPEQPAPQVPLWDPVQLDMFPIFPFFYRESEDEEMTSRVGRGFLDQPRQEAQTAIVSSFVNSLMRASNIFAAPDSQDSPEGAMRQLDVKLEHGKIYNKPLKFFHMDYPPVTVLQALNFLQTANAQETGQVDFAVMNRQDARKTATELGQAKEESELIKSVPLAIFSEDLRKVLQFTWKIVQSLALQGEINLLLIPQPQMVLINGVETPSGGIDWVNDIESLSQTFDVRPAGDVDFVERVQKTNQMKQDWPVISATGAKTEFLQDLVRLQYPEKGDKYAKLIEEGDPLLQLLTQLATVLGGSIQPEEYAALDEKEKMELQQMEQAVQQITGNQDLTFVPRDQPQTL